MSKQEDILKEYVTHKFKIYKKWLDESLTNEEVIDLGIGYIMLMISIKSAIDLNNKEERNSNQSLIMINNIIKKEMFEIDHSSSTAIVMRRIMDDMTTWRIS